MVGSTRIKRVAGAGVAVALLGLLATPAAHAATPASDESLLFSLTNTARAAVGVAPLTLNSTLSSIARQWAATMASQNAISHNPDLKAQIEGAGYTNWTKTGENVGMGPTLTQINSALLASEHHYENITDPDFQQIGVGVVYAANSVWIVEDFLTLSGASAPAPAPAPTPAPTPARAPVVTTPPTTVPPPPTTTTTEAPTTTTTEAPTTTTTTLPPAPATGLPLRLALMVQELRGLSASR